MVSSYKVILTGTKILREVALPKLRGN